MVLSRATPLIRSAASAAARPATVPPAQPIHYLITIPDFTDADAPARRMAARPAHLKHAASLQEKGLLLAGGAQLTDQDKMFGSMFLLDMPSKEAVMDLMRTDPYVTGRVWDLERVWVQKVKLARLGTLKE